MKKSRLTDEQVIGFLKHVEGGVPVKDLCRKPGFSDATFNMDVRINWGRAGSGPVPVALR